MTTVGTLPSDSIAVDQTLQQAITLHQAGNLQEAERLYRVILKTVPEHPDANHNLGVLALQVNQAGLGLQYFKAALETKPDQDQYWISYIEALIQTDDAETARQVLVHRRECGLNGESIDKLEERLDSMAYKSIPYDIPHVSDHNSVLTDKCNRKQRRAAEKRTKAAFAKTSRTTQLRESIATQSASEPTSEEIEQLVHLLNQCCYSEAESIAQKLMDRIPKHGLAWKALGVALYAQGRTDESLEPMQKAAILSPMDIEAHNNLGKTLKDLGRLEEAAASYRRALEIKPDYADAHCNLGNALFNLGRTDEALASHRRALEIKPNYAEEHNNIGNALRDLGRMEEAESSYRRALEIKPDFAEAHCNLGSTLKDIGRLEEAESSYRRTLEIKPDFAEAHCNLGNTLKDMGRLEEAESSYRRALEIKPDLAEAHGNLLFTLHYIPYITRHEIMQAYLEWVATLIRRIIPYSCFPPAVWNSPKPLRLGLVSGSFKRHPVGYMTLGSLPLLIGQGFELVFFNETVLEDDFTAHFRDCASSWYGIRGLSDESLANLIRECSIDILIDLAGHSQGCRLGAVAHRAAPLQLKWVGGLFNTTGLPEMDYLLSDHLETPEGTDQWYTEKLIRMPHGYVSYLPPDYTPLPGDLPFDRNGFITFGCFNNGTKINSELAALWGRILNAVPQSRLLLQCAQLSDDSTRILFSKRLEAGGVPVERVEMRGKSPHPELLKRYNEVDIALDTWPYSGGLTTCEALYMGVPVISLPGPTFAGRHSCTHLYNVGLPCLVVSSPDEYVELAVHLAGEPKRLRSLRVDLREQVLASPLCDHQLFAEHLASALRLIWSRHCAGKAPEAITITGVEKIRGAHL